MNKNTFAGFGIGVGVGLFIGAVVALLYAPQSGKETRKFVREKAKAVRDKVSGRFKKKGPSI